MTRPQVSVERDPAGFLRVLLARPDRRNALNPAMAQELLAALRSDEAAVIVLGSSDPRAFCAGADLGIDDAGRAVVSDLLYQCYELMISRPGPVIAVVTGPAVGGGAQLAAAADLRVAGHAARFRWTGPPSPQLAVGAWVLPALVGRGLALELTLTGRWVEAQEAADRGLVNWIDDEPGRLAMELATSLLARGQAAAGQVKHVASAGGLLERLRAERAANHAAWAPLPSPSAGGSE
jgi:enoyl-CoA hydratase/carnithine racemase